MASRAEAISLYRSLMRSSKQFSTYNFREYFLRRTREDFRQHKSETDPAKIKELLESGRREVAILRVQQKLQQLFQEKSVLEVRKDRAAAAMKQQ